MLLPFFGINSLLSANHWARLYFDNRYEALEEKRRDSELGYLEAICSERHAMSSGTETNESRSRLNLNLPHSKLRCIATWWCGVVLELCFCWFPYAVSYFLCLIVFSHSYFYESSLHTVLYLSADSLPLFF